MKIALSGMSGSGKSEAARRLVQKFGFIVTSTGGICRGISKKIFDDESKAHLNSISLAIRDVDQDFFIRTALRDISAERVVFDSIRYASDVVALKEFGFVTWRIDCPDVECMRRLKSRGQEVTVADLSHPSELELRNATFDQIFFNHGKGVQEFIAEIDSAVDLLSARI